MVALWRARRADPPPERWRSCWWAGRSLASARTHPDYLAYFNELAGDHPERILVDSDLDDGQDLKRLADTLRARRVPAVSLAYAGSATVAEHGLPPIRWLEPHRPVTGWVAASLYSLKLGSLDRPGHDDFAWLERYRPVARVGRSIRLYYIPTDSPREGSGAARGRKQHHDQRRQIETHENEWPPAANMASSDIPGAAGTSHLGEGRDVAQAGQRVPLPAGARNEKERQRLVQAERLGNARQRGQEPGLRAPPPDQREKEQESTGAGGPAPCGPLLEGSRSTGPATWGTR